MPLMLILVADIEIDLELASRLLKSPLPTLPMLVLALHTAYLVMLFAGIGTPGQRMGVALAGYAAYIVNAAQFLWKLRMARLQGASASESAPRLAVAR